MHQLHISFPQHALYLLPVSSDGKGSMQIGQSSFGAGCLKSSISCNSATRLSHFFLCLDRCFFLQAALQYFASLHLLQMFRSLPSLPQHAHLSISVHVMCKLFSSSVHVICCSSSLLQELSFSSVVLLMISTKYI